MITGMIYGKRTRERANKNRKSSQFPNPCCRRIAALFIAALLLLYPATPILHAASAEPVTGTAADVDLTAMTSYTDAFPFLQSYKEKPVITGEFAFPSMDGQGDAKGRFFYSDGYFTDPASVYNAQLASMSLCFACSSMASSKAKKISYKNKSSNARHLLDRIGFKDICVNSDFVSKPGQDTIGVVMGRKEIDTPGGTYTLISVGIRGAGYEQEWVGNMKMGSAGDAEGFHTAAVRAEEAVAAYIDRYSIDTDRAKFWIAGFSRAGAVTDLLTRELTNAYDPGGTNVYGYSFATPRGAFKKSKTYPNSHCVINTVDAIPCVAPEYMGFTHYGDDMRIGGHADGFQGYKMVFDMIIDLGPLTVPKGIDFELSNDISTQDQLIDKLITAVQYSIAPDRASYTSKVIEDGQTAEEIFSFILRFLMSADEQLISDISDSTDDITKNIGGFVLEKTALMKEAIQEGIDTLDPEDKDNVYTSLWGCFKPALEKNVPPSDLETIKSMWRSLMHILFDLAHYDYVNSGSDGFNIIGTLINNISSIYEAHTPEKYLELVTSQDSNYTGINWAGGAQSEDPKVTSKRIATEDEPSALLLVTDFDNADIIVKKGTQPAASIHAGRTAGSRDADIYMGREKDDGSDLKGDTNGVLYLQAVTETTRALYGDPSGTYDVCLIANENNGEMIFDSWIDEKGVALTHEKSYIVHIEEGKTDHGKVKPVYKEAPIITAPSEEPLTEAASGGAADQSENEEGGSGLIWILVPAGILLAGGGGGLLYLTAKRKR